MNPTAASDALPADERNACLSALADGDASALQPGCALWRDDADARATWHAYHLIGDVLRSEDLAASPARDLAFLSSLRERLAQEPVVLAPATAVPAAQAAATASARRKQFWLLPAAAAAGFVVVAGVMVLTRTSAPTADGPVVAIGGRADPAVRPVVDGAAPVGTLVIPGQVIRDARLDAYLRAHRDAMGWAPAALPGGVPRNIETLAPAEPAAAAKR